MGKIINFDHAAATQPLPEVVEAMKPYLSELYGNPSSMSQESRDVKMAIENAR